MYRILSLIILPYKNSFPNDSENVFSCSNVLPYSFSEILNALYFYPIMIINFKIKILVLC